jgi:hypothetical protein
MAAQMEVNQTSDNTVTGNSAGDLPNDGTGMSNWHMFLPANGQT